MSINKIELKRKLKRKDKDPQNIVILDFLERRPDRAFTLEEIEKGSLYSKIRQEKYGKGLIITNLEALSSALKFLAHCKDIEIICLDGVKYFTVIE